MTSKGAASKPLHPATVHFPIAFIFLAVLLDVFSAVPLPKALETCLPSPHDSPQATYFLLSLGLLTSIPAVLSGVAQAKKTIAKQGLHEVDGTTIKLKFKALIGHALINDVVILGLTFVWWKRRSLPAGVLELWMLVTEVVLAAMQLFAAGIGGKLVYQFGFGLAMGGQKSVKSV
ncbi:hypothetical protein K470DRAFT_258870 [Piedraia hortae CBS 480.64]|uniref:DUF2231 domain-containing protein n=1 Tax=Piedraia hortae CBS 480.64 TaxID=1314780 RepID=A0A6A7BVZ8_9PEZI|nr:hypothetical protein K470DRAFT_258870 [Piedraia hortae CBS 480.64]